MEYTILAFISVLAVLIVDLLLKTRLIRNKKFWIFWVVMFILIFIVNGYLTWRPIVLYGEGHYMGIRIFTIPIEDFLYGFSLITLNIAIWEFMTQRITERRGSQTNLF
jgi:lycopene cyclase domain-containing protein